jgi:hypothetical protein
MPGCCWVRTYTKYSVFGYEENAAIDCLHLLVDLTKAAEARLMFEKSLSFLPSAASNLLAPYTRAQTFLASIHLCSACFKGLHNFIRGVRIAG